MSLNKYLVYCISEGIRVPSDYVAYIPTQCPNNNTHIIDPTLTVINDTAGPASVMINQNSDYANGGFFRVDSYQLSISGGIGATSSIDISYAYNVDCYSTGILPTSSNIGDTIEVVTMPNTVIGTITAPVSIGATGVNSTATALLHQGFLFSITDGTNTDTLGQITSLDLVGNNIYFSIPTVHSYGTGATIMFGIERIRTMQIVNTNPILFGLSRISSTGLPAGAIVQINYTNNGLLPKTLYVYAEISY